MIFFKKYLNFIPLIIYTIHVQFTLKKQDNHNHTFNNYYTYLEDELVFKETLEIDKDYFVRINFSFYDNDHGYTHYLIVLV